MKKTVVFILILSAITVRAFAQEPKAIDSLKNLISKAKEDTAKVNLLDDLCWEYLYYDPQKCLPFAEQAIQLAHQLGYEKGEGKLLNTMGVAYANLTMFEKAKERYQKALILKDKTGDELGKAKTLVNIGNLYLFQADYNEAISSYTMALPIFEKLGHRQNMATTYGNIASIYERQQNYELELFYAEKSLKIAQEVGYLVTIMDSKILIGNVYKTQKKYTDALHIYEEALAIASRTHDMFATAMCHHNIGNVYKSIGKSDEALKHFQSQSIIAEKLNSENDRLYAFMGIGESYLVRKDLRLSEQFLFKALLLAKKLGLRDEKMQLYFDLSKLYEARQEFAKVVQYQNLYMDLKDSLFSESKSKQINELTIKYEAEKKQNEIELLSKNNLLQSLELNKARLLRNIFIAGTVFLFALAVLLYYNFHQRVRANRLLTEQKQELQDSNTVKTKLFSAISHDLRSPLTSLHGLLQIMEEKDTSSDLKPFMNHANLMMGNTMTLLDNLLYWSARQVKGIPIQFTKVSLHQAAEENISLLSAIAKIKQVDLSHRLSVEDWVYADVSSVHFIFRNLISNALKFTKPNGEISISGIRINDHIEIAITDTGIGIASSAQAQIFNRSNVSTHGTGNEKGTGLGLLLCKEFVEKNGGKIWLESSSQSGTVFKFTLRYYNSPEGFSPNRFTNFLSTTKA